MNSPFETSPDRPLGGDFDLELMLSEVPRAFSVKGMFFAQQVAALGEGWDAVRATLEAPPVAGRYRAFDAYPMRDHLRLCDAVARLRTPDAPREAHRSLGRGEVAAFAATTLGRVTFSLLGEPGAALLRYPELYRVLVTGTRLRAASEGEHRVVLSFEDFVGSVEHALGVVEGIVLAFAASPRITADPRPGPRGAMASLVFEVAW